MIVIARIKSITKHEATEDANPFNLEDREAYFLCQIEKMEHFVGLEGEECTLTDYCVK